MTWVSDYEETLERWKRADWSPEFEVWKEGWIIWVCQWTGPMGGRHEHRALTRTGAVIKAKQEIAHWSTVLRRQRKRSLRKQRTRTRLRA